MEEPKLRRVDYVTAGFQTSQRASAPNVPVVQGLTAFRSKVSNDISKLTLKWLQRNYISINNFYILYICIYIHTYIHLHIYTKTTIMASSPITSWQTDGKKVETVTDFIFLGYKITADSD